ncbi:MAG: DUF503 domain-containing protein [Calditrichaeota bacterium]|nr:DUF503 domain-containing protein [Calditrichota bacterium]
MRLTLLIYDLHLPGCESLKEKRRIFNGLKERLMNRYHVSAAEVAYQEKWQRSRLAVAWVASDAGQSEEIAAAIERTVNMAEDLIIAGRERRDY